MIQLIQQPDELVFSKNPVIFSTHSTDGGGNNFAARGVYSEITAPAAARFISIHTVTITWVDPDLIANVVVFVGQNSQPTSLPDSSFVGSNAEYWAAVAQVIGSWPTIAPFFSVTSRPAGANFIIKISAKNTIVGWTLTPTTNTPLAIFTENTITADSMPANYKARVEVFFESDYGAGNFVLVAQLEAQPDLNGMAFFDISGILTAQFQNSLSELPFPVFDANTPFVADNLRKYYVRFGESFGTPAAIIEWQTQYQKRVINGGISQSMNAEGNYLESKSSVNAFLTWHPDGKTIGLSQPEWLPFYNYFAEPLVVYITRIWYNRDTLAVGGTANIFQNIDYIIEPGATLMIPVSPTAMLVETFPESFKFTVQVRSKYGNDSGALPGFVLSELRTFYLDHDFYRSCRYLQFLNGFGCVETMMLTGAFEQSAKIDRAFSRGILRPDFGMYSANETQYRAEAMIDFTYRTGFITSAQAAVLLDMLTSNDICDVQVAGYIPLRLLSSDFDLADTDKQLHSYSIKAKPRLNLRNFSAKKLAVSTMSGNAWLTPNGVNWDTLLVSWDL